MTQNRKSSLPVKLIGFGAVVASVVFSTQQRGGNVRLDKLPDNPVAVYPVDRDELSQSIMPMDVGDARFHIPTPQRLTLDTIAADSNLTANSKVTVTRVEPKGPSAHELKLSDQQAWGSRQRQVDLLSKRNRSIDRPAVTKITSSDLPLVPGIEDPHLWYEESFKGELAATSLPANSLDTSADSMIPIELTKGPFDFSEPLQFSLLPPLQTPKTVLSEPVEFVTTKKTEAPVARSARAWETGRY